MVNTLADFDNLFDTEEKCRIFLENIRWDSVPKCPYCGYVKIIYVIENGERKKCGNISCYKKFSVKTKSFIHASKLPLKIWLTSVFLYIKTKGRFSISSLPEKLSWVTCYVVDMKIKEIFYNVHKDYGDADFLFKEACRQIFVISEKASHYNRTKFMNTHILSPTELIDFQNDEQYKRIVYFTTRDMHYAIQRGWCFYKFCDAEEIIAECLIYIADSDMPIRIDGDLLISLLRKTRLKMWTDYVKAHPNIENYIRIYNKEYKKRGRVNMSNFYLKELLRKKLINMNLWRPDLNSPQVEELIRNKRIELGEKRKRLGVASNIQFNEKIDVVGFEYKVGKLNYVVKSDYDGL